VLECSICKARRIDRNGTYLTVTVHSGGKLTEFTICGSRCFSNYGASAGLVARPGVPY